jgi:hypothetical protein
MFLERLWIRVGNGIRVGNFEIRAGNFESILAFVRGGFGFGETLQPLLSP